jgi:hypothetical protein
MTDLLDALKDVPLRFDRRAEFLSALKEISKAHELGYSLISIFEALTSQNRFHGSYGQFCYLARRFLPKRSSEGESPKLPTSVEPTPPKTPEPKQLGSIAEDLKKHSITNQSKSVFHWPPRPVKDLL